MCTFCFILLRFGSSLFCIYLTKKNMFMKKVLFVISLKELTLSNTVLGILMFLISVSAVCAQAPSPGDTITVHAHRYNQSNIRGWSGVPRDTTINFGAQLPDGLSFEKILMSYNIRCRDGLISTAADRNKGCGEWDFECNTYIHDPSRIEDLARTHPKYRVSGPHADPFEYTTKPTYDYYDYSQTQTTSIPVPGEGSYSIGSGTDGLDFILPGNKRSAKSHHLYTAEELITAGFSSSGGNIDAILVFSFTAAEIRFLRIRILGTTKTAIDATQIDTENFREVYFSNHSFLSRVENRIYFREPYSWNGTDNLIVEFSFTHSNPTQAVLLQGGGTGTAGTAYAHNGFYCDLSAHAHFTIPAEPLSEIDNEITISFWARVTGSKAQIVIRPDNDEKRRIFNLHFAGSINNVVFGCGGSLDSFDEIQLKDNAPGPTLLDWHHWAFTKNASTGKMKIYKNGELKKEGDNKNIAIDMTQVDNLLLGKDARYRDNFKGDIDELRIWKKELTAEEIKNWMQVSITNDHPQYDHLVAYYKFDEGTGRSIASSVPDATESSNATGNTSVSWKYRRGIDLDRFFTTTSARPNITFLRGTYNITPTSATVRDSVQRTPNLIETLEVRSHTGEGISDEIVTSDERLVWEAIPQKVYNASTNAETETIDVTPTDSLDISLDPLNYYTRRPSKVEIMSFVTPYGVGLDLGPKGKTWVFDVSDFAPILKDKKRITIENSGQWLEDMDIRFHFIVGTPPRDVLEIRQIWPVRGRTSNADVRADKYFAPQELMMHSRGEAFKIRSSITGHEPQGEFSPLSHSIKVTGPRGEETSSWNAWKECAENPIYPQGGTWIFDRAGWCPGMPTDVHHFDITPYVSAGETASIDYNMEEIIGKASYIASHQLVSYGAPHHTLDAAVVEVRKPSDRVEFSRFGTICHTPTVVIQNTGSQSLSSLTIKYWINDASTRETYNWTGNLGTMESDSVDLPTPFTFWDNQQTSNNTFYVEIEAPNGGTDEYTHNNMYRSPFKAAPEFPAEFEIVFRANQNPSENSYEIIDEEGKVLFSRTKLRSNRTNTTQVRLPVGCYTYKVYDSDDDGLEFPFNRDGSGYTRIEDADGENIHEFEPDFGKSLELQFSVPVSEFTEPEITHDNEDNDDDNQIDDFRFYPNPSDNELRYELSKVSPEAELKMFNSSGEIVLQKDFSDQKDTSSYKGTIDMSTLPSGIYIIQLIDKDTKSTRIINK